MTIVPFLKDSVFGPQDIQSMSTALEDVCNILNVADEAKSQREQLAKKIITLARQERCNAALLRDRLLREIADGQDGWAAVLVRAARRGAL
jgi:ABC-type hemin transport system substrate-binding protein